MSKFRIFSQFNKNCVQCPVKESVDVHKLDTLDEVVSFQDAFDALDRLYEAEEQTAAEQPTGEAPVKDAEQQDKATSIQDIQAAVKDVEIPEPNIKLEGKADELYDQLIKILKESSLKDAVNILELVSQDPKLSLLLRHGFTGGSAEDGKLTVEMSNIVLPVAKLIPTQAEIGISNSLDNLVTGTYNTKDKDGNPAKGQVNYAGYFAAKAPLPKPFVYAGTGGYYIVDGHHRWSQAYCMNPEGNIECELISTKGTTLGDEQILKNFQAAIAADPNRSGLGRKAAGFQNLFGATLDTLKNVVKPMTDETAKKITAACPADRLDAAVKEVQIEEGTEDQKRAQALLVSNALKLAKTNISGKPLRILMPQTNDDTNNLVSQAIAGV